MSGWMHNLKKPFSDIIKAPGFIVPWLDRFYEPAEIRLLEKFVHPLPRDLFQQTPGVDPDKINRLFLRRVFIENQNKDIEPAGFHARYDIWALFEGFKDIPDKIRDALNRWELDHYIRTHEKAVDRIRQTGSPDPFTPRYLLLDETFDVLDEAERIYLWPCNCRSMINACKKPVYTCLRFDNGQGQGFEISKEKAKEIVLFSNKKGLMQSGELWQDSRGRLKGAVCNCCPDCCFPHLLAREIKAEKLWPQSRYIADWKEEKCSYCGLCAKRCPFHAFHHDPSKENKKDRIRFSGTLCRGCGLCAVTCPTEAVRMKKIKEI